MASGLSPTSMGVPAVLLATVIGVTVLCSRNPLSMTLSA
jgi:lipopolysaccharide export LptBFGC system permease protein LptF